jgi:periplasmic protein CpxP/Spy
MKKQLLSVALSTLFGMGVAIAAPQTQDQPAASGQTAETPHRHQADPNHQLKMLTKRLNLTADQQNQLLPILTDRQQQMQAIRNDNTLAPKDRRAKMRALREDSEAKIKNVLTDDQKQTYDQMRERAQQRREQRQQNAGPGTDSGT